MEYIKKLLRSKTVLLAILQAVVGIGVAVLTELDLAGYIIVLKSVADIFMRVITVEAIDEK